MLVLFPVFMISVLFLKWLKASWVSKQKVVMEMRMKKREAKATYWGDAEGQEHREEADREEQQGDENVRQERKTLVLTHNCKRTNSSRKGRTYPTKVSPFPITAPSSINSC